jgi:hypothetical protein
MNDVGLFPHDVVRQAAAEKGRQDRSILPDAIDQRVERRGEPLLNRLHVGVGPAPAQGRFSIADRRAEPNERLSRATDGIGLLS